LKISGYLLEASIYVHADFQRSVTFRSKMTAKLRKDPLNFLMGVFFLQCCAPLKPALWFHCAALPVRGDNIVFLPL